MSKHLSLTELLFNLVSIPSVNPRVKDASPSSNEIELAHYIFSILESNGIDVRMQEVENGRTNVIAHLKRGETGDNAIILLSAHMDTYPGLPEEFEARIKNNILHGRGSADAKGSLAAMMHAFLNAAKVESRRETYLVASIDEEHAMLGAKKLAELGIHPDLAITGEPTQLIPIVMQKGIIRGIISIFGESSHAAYPKKQNAIFSAGKLLQLLELFNESMKAEKNVTELTPTCLTPTRIIGDGDMNSTPKTTTIWFDARFLPNLSENQYINKLTNFLTENIVGNFDFKIEPPLFISPPNSCEIDTPIVSQFLKIIEKVNGSCRPGAFSYGSEAGVFSSFSRASLVFGPGDPKYSHKPGECVDLLEVEKAEQIYSRLLTETFLAADVCDEAVQQQDLNN